MKERIFTFCLIGILFWISISCSKNAPSEDSEDMGYSPFDEPIADANNTVNITDDTLSSSIEVSNLIAEMEANNNNTGDNNPLSIYDDENVDEITKVEKNELIIGEIRKDFNQPAHLHLTKFMMNEE